jgi:hypothetical protein
MAPGVSFVSTFSERPASRWNPFRVRGTVLPPNVLLMVKLLALCFFLTGQWNLLPDHFLPFLPIFDRAGPPAVFQRALQILFVLAAASLILNYYVRASCVVLGGLLFIAILSSRVYYENNRTFTGCLWFLAGLYVPGQKPWLIRYQVILLYFGAALNKLLDSDWRSGQFFENWVVRLVHHPVYIRISSLLPSMWLSRFMSWTTTATEFILAGGFLLPRFYPLIIWVGVAYHTALVLATGGTFGMFYYATLSSFLAFLTWPQPPISILYSGDKAYGRKLQSALEKMDLDGVVQWSEGPRTETQRELQKRRMFAGLHPTVSHKTYSGLAALYVLLLYNPLTYFAFAAVLSLPRSTHSASRNVLAIVFLFFVSPALLAPAARVLMPGGHVRTNSRQ